MIIHTAEQAISRLPHVQLDNTFPARDILHMILAGGTSQTLYNLEKGCHERALEYLCSQPGPFPDIHENEFLGTLAVAGVHFNSAFSELAERAMDSYRDSNEDHSWSLMLFSAKPGVSSEWTNSRGELHSTERVLESVISTPFGKGPCFGTHAVEAISFAISRFCIEFDQEPSQLRGTWEKAFDYVKTAVQMMKKNQNDDGSINRCWFRSSAIPRNLSQWKESSKDVIARRFRPSRAIVYPTGHCLDSISSLSVFFADDREWIDNAGYIVAQTIEMHWAEVVKDIAPFTHAVHALKLLDL